jgi:hypothetical protein
MWNMLSDHRQLLLFASLAIKDGIPLLGTVLNDVVADFRLSFQTGKQPLLSNVALKRFKKSAVAVTATASARRGPVPGE